MNLLLVDDEEYVIDSMKKNVDWRQLEIDEVYTANSMLQAKKLMECIPIQVVISDIVMPQGSGFDFMNWIREQSYQVQVIFQTSYAEFDYAKKAIAFDSVDYLLKPIDFSKLTQTIGKAIQRVKEAQKVQNYEAESRNWKRSKQQLEKNYWKELLFGAAETGEQAIAAWQQNAEAKLGDLYVAVYLQMNRKRSRQGNEFAEYEWEEPILGFTIQNVAEELAREAKLSIASVFSHNKSSYVMLFQSEKKTEDDEEKKIRQGREAADIMQKKPAHITDVLRKMHLLEDLSSWIQENLGFAVWIGIGQEVDQFDLRNSAASILKMRDNSLSVWNQVFYWEDYEQPVIQYQNTQLTVWETLLKEQKTYELQQGIRQYFEDLTLQSMVTRDILKKFRMDILQMVYTWLDSQEIKAHLLFSNQTSEQEYAKALENTEDAEHFAVCAVQKAIDYSRYVNKTASVTEQIKQYIDQHYQEDIRRDELAELVFLNTDYMSRIFKKEEGMSISTYLLNRRVEEAKKLLQGSNLPINTVSIYVGYSNFSYFTKMFRENTGYTPLEYRRTKAHKTQ